MIEEVDIWRAAEQMRKLYGADAVIHAAMRADNLLDQGDVEGCAMWKRVVTAINELERSAPRDGGTEALAA